MIDKHVKDTLTFVLAGGMGERLYPLTRDRAKPAVPFGGTYRIIDFTLSNALNSGFRKMLVLTQYKSMSLERHCRQAWGFLNPDMGEYVNCVPPQQRVNTNWYMGTADAIYQNIYTIKREKPAYVLILSGDHIYKMNYYDMLDHHIQMGAELTIACRPVDIEDGKRYGVMGIERTTRIKDFFEKSPTPPTMPDDPTQCLASMGIYIFNSETLVKMLETDACMAETQHDFGKNIIPGMVYDGHSKVYAFKFETETGEPAYWRDIGTVDAFWQAHMELTGAKPSFDLYDPNWPMWTMRRQQTPAKIFPNGDGGKIFDCLIADTCSIYGGNIEKSVVSPQVTIMDGVDIKESIIMEGASIGKNTRLNRVIVDKGVTIPADTEIGFDSEADKACYYVSPGGITVIPQPALMESGDTMILKRKK